MFFWGETPQYFLKKMEKDQKSRKEIISAIVLVLTVVLIAAISALIIGSVLDSEAFSGTSGTESNELTAVDNITAQNFDILGSRSTAVCTVTGVGNLTGGETIASGNYTLPTSCSILAADDSEYIGEDWAVNYTWITPGDAGSVINITELTGGFGSFVSGIVIFLAVIGIIIGILWLVVYIRPLFSKSEGIQSFDSS